MKGKPLEDREPASTHCSGRSLRVVKGLAVNECPSTGVWGGSDADRLATLTHLAAANQRGRNAFPEWEEKKSISGGSNRISARVIEGYLFICCFFFPDVHYLSPDARTFAFS